MQFHNKMVAFLLATSQLIASVNLEFIHQHLVSQEIADILDIHAFELEEMIQTCKTNKQWGLCLAISGGVRQFSWLPNKYVKYGIDRIWGAELLRDFILKHNINKVIIPFKYYYHIKGKPEDPLDDNYLIIADEIPIYNKPLTKGQTKQLVNIIKSLRLRDIPRLDNVVQTIDSKIAIIDTGVETFWKWDTESLDKDQQTYLNLRAFLDEKGEYLAKKMITPKACEFIVQEINDHISHVHNHSEWYSDSLRALHSYIKQLSLEKEMETILLRLAPNTNLP